MLARADFRLRIVHLEVYCEIPVLLDLRNAPYMTLRRPKLNLDLCAG